MPCFVDSQVDKDRFERVVVVLVIAVMISFSLVVAVAVVVVVAAAVVVRGVLAVCALLFFVFRCSMSLC